MTTHCVEEVFLLFFFFRVRWEGGGRIAAGWASFKATCDVFLRVSIVRGQSYR